MGFFRCSSLNILLLCFILTFHGFILVQSQQDQARPQSPPPPPFENTSPPLFVMQSPPIPFTPPPPHVNTPPPPQAVVGINIPTPISPLPPSPPPPPISNSPLPPPPAHASPPQSNSRESPHRNHRRPSPPPPQPPRVFKQSEKSGLNTGKTVGLVFAGFAAMLQICVVAFLVFKRKQLLRMTHTY